MYRKYFIALFIPFIWMACDESSNDIGVEQNPLKSSIIEENNAFSFDVFKAIEQNEEPNKNIFVSPLSMYYALAMAGIGAETETKQEFLHVLGWENTTEEEVLSAINNLYTELQPTDAKIKLSIANSLWQKEGALIKESYKGIVRTNFDAEVRTLDFNSPVAVETINSWIEVKTNDLIQDMLDQISPDAIMYLINAIYFKAPWKYEFEEKNNYEGAFKKADGTTSTATFMHQKTNLNYLNNELFSAVQLPYTDSNYCMTILLPNNDVEMASFMGELNQENWNEWSNDFTMKEVDVSLPKFKFSFGTRNINKELQSLGLEKAFSPLDADFSNITDTQIFISRVLHKAFIEVNESGSEAAAATIVEFEYTSVGNTTNFNANKPFIFTIEHKPTNTLLFIGKLAWPED